MNPLPRFVVVPQTPRNARIVLALFGGLAYRQVVRFPDVVNTVLIIGALWAADPLGMLFGKPGPGLPTGPAGVQSV